MKPSKADLMAIREDRIDEMIRFFILHGNLKPNKTVAYKKRCLDNYERGAEVAEKYSRG